MQHKNRKTIIILVIVIMLSHFYSEVFAGPTSTNYELRNYGFGSGGTQDSDSTNYGMFGILGGQDGETLGSTNYQVGGGLVFNLQPALPPSATFTNPDNNYDRLKIIIDPTSNPGDVSYAIAISDDDFATTYYIQDDETIGTTLGLEDFQTYGNWGGASGFYVTGLNVGTSYKIRIKARQGLYTETGWGQEASASTVHPTLTFSIDSDTITFDNLSPSNSYTDNSKSTTLTTTTNAYNGYVIYGYAEDELSYFSDSINHYSSANASPTSWTGYGFGYTTSDSSLVGGTADRFTNGGPNYAGFEETGPGDPVADHPGPVITTISNEQFTVSYRVQVQNSQPAGRYITNLIYVIVPTY